MNDTNLLDWLEQNHATITHDSSSCSIDMSGDKWTISWQDYSKRPARNRVRGHTIREAIYKAERGMVENNGESLKKKLDKECLDW